jgi:hypothetical protein
LTGKLTGHPDWSAHLLSRAPSLAECAAECAVFFAIRANLASENLFANDSAEHIANGLEMASPEAVIAYAALADDPRAKAEVVPYVRILAGSARSAIPKFLPETAVVAE